MLRAAPGAASGRRIANATAKVTICARSDLGQGMEERAVGIATSVPAAGSSVLVTASNGQPVTKRTPQSLLFHLEQLKILYLPAEIDVIEEGRVAIDGREGQAREREFAEVGEQV